MEHNDALEIIGLLKAIEGHLGRIADGISQLEPPRAEQPATLPDFVIPGLSLQVAQGIDRGDISQIVPLLDNPILQDGEAREVLFECQCRNWYRLLVNGNRPIPDVDAIPALCPRCGRRPADAQMKFGHSAGYFNASEGSWLIGYEEQPDDD